jgi:hypothetical protein
VLSGLFYTDCYQYILFITFTTTVMSDLVVLISRS